MSWVRLGEAAEVFFRFFKIELLTMLGEPWLTFGCLGGSLDGPGSIFNRFGVPFYYTLGIVFPQNRASDNVLSDRVFDIVLGSIFNRFWVFPGASRPKSIEIQATIANIQVSEDLQTRWFRGAPGVDFS